LLQTLPISSCLYFTIHIPFGGKYI
jgi:hypothetical protein